MKLQMPVDNSSKAILRTTDPLKERKPCGANFRMKSTAAVQYGKNIGQLKNQAVNNLGP